jgi:2-polyprenyl-3-methyl-5-hydroxy-6-metoxy-1,4-benzoquinol methylase
MNIDVNELIASRDMAGHNEAHNKYFTQYDDWRVLARQPFASADSAGPILACLSATLQAANLTLGVRVLDYGCGTGWLSKYLGYLGCRVTGADVAQTAIDMAEKALAADPLSDPARVDFKVIDGIALPFDDGTFERIICFSSFHHVADQRGTLAEFFRVLKPGGMAIFSEPQEGHSDSEEAQSEMQTYGVIETEVRIEDMAKWGNEIGFNQPQMSFFLISPIGLQYDQFQKARANGLVRTIGDGAFKEMLELRCFSLLKPGISVADSRSAADLNGSLSIELLHVVDDKIHWRASYRNTGTCEWLPSVTDTMGAVFIGYKTASVEKRIHLGTNKIECGKIGTVDFTTPVITGKMVFRLVSEHIAWFGEEVTMDDHR